MTLCREGILKPFKFRFDFIILVIGLRNSFFSFLTLFFINSGETEDYLTVRWHRLKGDEKETREIREGTSLEKTNLTWLNIEPKKVDPYV